MQVSTPCPSHCVLIGVDYYDCSGIPDSFVLGSRAAGEDEGKSCLQVVLMTLSVRVVGEEKRAFVICGWLTLRSSCRGDFKEQTNRNDGLRSKHSKHLCYVPRFFNLGSHSDVGSRSCSHVSFLALCNGVVQVPFSLMTTANPCRLSLEGLGWRVSSVGKRDNKQLSDPVPFFHLVQAPSSLFTTVYHCKH